MRETYAPGSGERPATPRADQPAPASRENAPAARNSDERPAQAQGPRENQAQSHADNSGARSSSAESDEASSDTQAAEFSPGVLADTKEKDRGAAKGAVVRMQAKGLIEKFADESAPMAMNEAVLAALAATVRPQDGDNQHDEGPADADAAHDPRRVDGIATALTRIARNHARAGQTQDGERTSRNNAETRGDEEKTAKASAAADTRGRQAADLAQKVGPGGRIAVEVNVADDAKTLVSRPIATLATTSVAERDGKPTASQANGGQNANGLTTANSLTAVAAPAAAAAVAPTNAPQAAAMAKTAAIGEVGATTATQGGTNTPGQAQSGAQGPATAQTQSPAGAGAANSAQAAQRPAASFRAEILEQISVNIQKAVKDGADKITIQLRPAELGRVDVRIEVTSDGRAQVHVTADRADTLDLLQRDARDLARALQDAGLRADAGSLQFGLREQAAEQRQNRAKSNGNGRDSDAADAAGIEAIDSLPAWAPTNRPDRVDIRA